jgi:hypothetical protein
MFCGFAGYLCFLKGFLRHKLYTVFILTPKCLAIRLKGQCFLVRSSYINRSRSRPGPLPTPPTLGYPVLFFQLATKALDTGRLKGSNLR